MDGKIEGRVWFKN